MTSRAGLLLAVICLGLATSTRAAELGDPAPPLSIASWVSGRPVNIKAPAKDGQRRPIYVIEFWATWCPPGVQSIPHLSELQAKYPDDVVIVGISSEQINVVKPFVKRMGDKMTYRVAIDRDRQTTKAYMEAFNVGGIPHAFVIDRAGKLAWHGHPMDGLDQVLEDLNAGAGDAGTDPPNDTQPGMSADAQPEAPADDEFVGPADAEVSDNKPLTDESRRKFDELLSRYRRVLTTPTSEKARVERMGRQLFELAGNDPQLLNQLARDILTTAKVKHRDRALALQAAKLASEHAGNTDGPSPIHTPWHCGKPARGPRPWRCSAKPASW